MCIIYTQLIVERINGWSEVSNKSSWHRDWSHHAGPLTARSSTADVEPLSSSPAAPCMQPVRIKPYNCPALPAELIGKSRALVCVPSVSDVYRTSHSTATSLLQTVGITRVHFIYSIINITWTSPSSPLMFASSIVLYIRLYSPSRPYQYNLQ